MSIRMSGLASALLCALAIHLFTAGLVDAQGVTTGAISGTLTDAQGRPVPSAQVRVTNLATGYTTQTLSRPNGLFLAASLEVGGPYRVEASLLGFGTQTRDGVFVRLSTTTRVDLLMSEQAIQVAGIEVSVARDGEFSPTRSGVSTVVSDTLVRRIPTLSRDFANLVKLTPQVVQPANDGPSAGGSWNRFNTFTIDGANQSERFNLASSGGVPGGATGGKLISIDAVKEFRVLLTPTDVRQGNFVGMLVNAVTKSGTNQLTGGATLAYRDESLAAEPLRQNELNVMQYGFQLGGPIIADRLHFYVAPEWQRRDSPAAGPYYTAGGGSSPSPSSVPLDSLVSIRNIVQQQFGVDAGSELPVTLETPLSNLFGRIDFRISDSHRLVFRQLFNRAEDISFSRDDATLNTSPSAQNRGFRLGSNQFSRVNTNNSSVVQLFSSFANGSSNELIAGYNTITDERNVPVKTPEVAVGVNMGGTVRSVVFGTEQFSPNNLLEQEVFELVNNYTLPIGAHTITLGARFDHTNIFNNFAQRAYGVYVFPTIASLQAAAPTGYSVGYDNSGTGRGIAADFGVQQFSVYAQDVWTANERLTLTYGLRADIPRQLDTPLPNDSLAVRSNGELRTDLPVKTQVLLSPRFGFNFDPSGDQRNQIRGNVGVFTSAPPYILLGNAYATTGMGLVTLTCTGSATPTFTMDVDDLPTACAGQAAPEPGRAGTAGVNLNDPDFKYPQYIAGSLGFDRRLPFNTVLTVEGIYRKALNGILIRDRNLLGPRMVNGQPYTDRDGRVLYADTINAAGVVTNTNQLLIPRMRAVNLTEGLIEVSNQSKDYNYSISAQLSRRFSEALDATIAYTYMQAKDIQSLTSDRAISNWRNGRQLSESHDELKTSSSVFERPHRFLAYGTYQLPWGTDLSLYYEGVSGLPVTYVHLGDLNGDGYNGNDPIYVPRDATDPNEARIGRTASGVFSLNSADAQAFEEFISSQACLDEQRGAIMERNSCRTPFQHRMDVSIRQSLPELHGQKLTLQLDVFNFLNFLNDDWGQIQLPTLSPTFNDQRVLIQQSRTPGPLNQSQPNLTFDNRLISDGAFAGTTTASNYQMQLTLRYSF